jgi:DNA-binding LacI/PurR family transcriptional regulator
MSSFIHELDKAGIVTVVLPRFDSATLHSLPVSAIVTALTGISGVGLPPGAPEGVPVIAVGLVGDEAGLDAFLRPDFNAASEALDYLKHRGGKLPAFLATPQPLAPVAAFEIGYRDWCTLHGVEPLFVVAQDTYEAANNLIAGGADSLLLLGDDGLPDLDRTLAAIADSGLTMPEDFMLLSLSESVRGQFTSPTVSTLSWPGHECGIAVARTVIDGLATGTFEPGKLEHRIDTRQSTDR